MNKNFLKFNDRVIYFLSIDGRYWIAIKPICESLGVDYIAQFKSIKKDDILGAALSNQTIQVLDDQARGMACLPEKYVYGWLFSIQSKSPELQEYKKQCYDVLYNHFHGSLTGRLNTLEEKKVLEKEQRDLKAALKDNPDVKRLKEIEELKKSINSELQQMDNRLLSGQIFELFPQKRKS